MCNVCIAEEVLAGKGKPVNFHTGHGGVVIQVRAIGTRPEFTQAKYKIRIKGKPWPVSWTKTKDLAGDMGIWGLDTKYIYRNYLVKEWINGGRKPTIKSITTIISSVSRRRRTRQ